MNWDAVKPLAVLIFTSLLKVVGGVLMTHGIISAGPGLETFTGVAMTAGGAVWSWWVQSGHLQAAAYLKKLTDTATTAAAVAVAKKMAPAAETGAAEGAKAAVERASIPPAIPTTIPVIILALILAALAFPDTARAQVKLVKPTGNIVNDIAAATGKTAVSTGTSALDNAAAALAKPFQDIANFIGDDATGAISLATVIPDLQDGHGQQCWMAMKQFGDVIKAHPVPITFHVIQDFETLRLLGMATNNLCSNVHCTQVFADATAMAQSASPIMLAIPSLHDLCTKVPQIAVVPPIAAPTAQ